jgi:hypothetical protein
MEMERPDQDLPSLEQASGTDQSFRGRRYHYPYPVCQLILCMEGLEPEAGAGKGMPSLCSISY